MENNKPCKNDIFQQACIWTNIPIPEKEYKFHPKRKWRFDYAWPDYKIALEVEGGIWTKGRHVRGTGFLKDMEKYNAATVLGWRVLRTTPTDLLKTDTLDLILICIN